MAQISTATTNFDRTVTALVIRTVLENLRDSLIWMSEGSYVKGSLIPGTNLLRHVAYGDLSVTDNTGTVTPGTVPWLNEGAAPTAEALTIGYAEYSAYQAGRLIQISDIALAESPNELFSIAAEKVARNALATIDLNVSRTISATTSMRYASTASARNQITNAMKLTGDEVRKHVAKMKTLNIPTFPDGTYRAIIHPNSVYDLQGDTATGGWLDAAKYAQPGALLNGEVGKYMGVRFIESNVMTYLGNLGATSADVYNTVFFGPEFFAFGDLQSIQSYMVRPGGDHGDPLAQAGLVGWKAMFGSKVLGVTEAGGYKVLRLEHGGAIDIP